MGADGCELSAVLREGTNYDGYHWFSGLRQHGRSHRPCRLQRRAADSCTRKSARSTTQAPVWPAEAFSPCVLQDFYAFFMPSFGIESGVVSIPDASQQKKPHPHPACHSGVECSRTIFWFSGVSLRGMPAQKTPSFASPAHARFAKVFSFAGCSRLLVLSYTVRDAKGVIRWRGADFSAWPPGPCTGIILPNLALSMQVSKWTQKRNLRLFLSKISHFL